DRLQDAWLGQLSRTALTISESLGYRPAPSKDVDGLQRQA
ncbi:IclR family transcriptional regulator, partial [Escherichia coli]|nr:IclR family transcriptional regulator [Escherichia coli]